MTISGPASSTWTSCRTVLIDLAIICDEEWSFHRRHGWAYSLMQKQRASAALRLPNEQGPRLFPPRPRLRSQPVRRCCPIIDFLALTDENNLFSLPPRRE